MSRGLRARCPAKINLALRVLGRRSDGFHELDTVFQAIDLWDDVEYVDSDVLRVRCDDPGVPSDEGNLAWTAAERLASWAGIPPRGEISIRKRIPSQGGLGGGSSDAAGALLLCSKAWGLQPAAEELARLAGELGSDVPFFLVGGTARGQGRGERVSALPDAPETPLVLGFPPFGVPTAEAFGRLAARLTHPENGVSLPDVFPHKWRAGKDFSLGANDLEPVVFDGWPELERFRDALLGVGARQARLSGSGSTVFGVFEAAGLNDGVLERLRADFAGWAVTVSRTVREGVRMEARG